MTMQETLGVLVGWGGRPDDDLRYADGHDGGHDDDVFRHGLRYDGRHNRPARSQDLRIRRRIGCQRATRNQGHPRVDHQAHVRRILTGFQGYLVQTSEDTQRLVSLSACR
jgi:hypothetical protein